MKSFKKFLSEIVTQASTQATKMGLKGDGHGDWYDKEGKLVAKTVNAKLKFFGSKRPPTPDERTKIEVDKQTAAKEDEKAEREEIRMREGDPADITIAFGRFNPPTTGHEKLLDTVATSSDDGDYVIVPSRSQDKKKNPLDADSKVEVMKQMFPNHSGKIVNDPANRTIFDVLKKAHTDGYSGVRIVGGADRQKEFDKLVNTYNGKMYQFDKVEVRSAGDRDPDGEGLEGMSASKQRKYAADNDFKGFLQGVPSAMNKEMAKQLFSNIRRGMKIEEGWNLWEIAPKFDWKNLRENYVNKNIFNIGDTVENINTGLVGRIIRRGTSYLICVTEDKIMFKSWLKDVTEAVTNSSAPSGVPASQRLIGTDAHRKYTETLLPGSSWGKQFINKYRKKSK